MSLSFNQGMYDLPKATPSALEMELLRLQHANAQSLFGLGFSSSPASSSSGSPAGPSKLGMGFELGFDPAHPVVHRRPRGALHDLRCLVGSLCARQDAPSTRGVQRVFASESLLEDEQAYAGVCEAVERFVQAPEPHHHDDGSSSSSNTALVPPKLLEVVLFAERELGSASKPQSQSHPSSAVMVGDEAEAEARRRLALLDQLVRLHNIVHVVSTDAPKDQAVVHLTTMLLHALLLAPSLVRTLSDEANAPKRAAVVGVFLKNVLHPSPVFAVHSDMYLASVKGLASLLPEDMRVPKQALDTVIRPALMQLCSPQRVLRATPANMVGLASAIELIPRLFNHTFACKVVSLLKLCATPDHELAAHPHRVQMAALMISAFRALHRFIDCSAFVADLCEVGAGLADARTGQVPDRLADALLSFLSLFPDASAAHLLGRPALCPLFRSLMQRPQARCSALWQAFYQQHAALMSTPSSSLSAAAAGGAGHAMRAFCLNPSMSDVTLVVGRHGATFPAHRIVLVQASPYFRSLLLGGMAEASQPTVSLPDMDAAAFEHALRFMYGHALDGTLEGDLLLRVLEVASYLCLDDLHAQCEWRLCTVACAETGLDLLRCLPSLHSDAALLRPLARECRHHLVASQAALGALDLGDDVVRVVLSHGMPCAF